MTPRLGTQLAQRVDAIAQKLNAQAPEAYAAVATDLKDLHTELTDLDQRRITAGLNDPSKGGRKPRKRSAKKAAKSKR